MPTWISSASTTRSFRMRSSAGKQLRPSASASRLLAPMAPHLTEELWARLGEPGSVMTAGWPAYDAAKLVSATITIVIQVNGKHRGDVTVAPDVTEAELISLAGNHPKVAPHLTEKTIRRTIYVKGRLINLIV